MLSLILWTTGEITCIFTKQPRIDELFGRLQVILLSCTKGVCADKSKRKPASQSQGDSVYKFKSGHTSTAGSTGALVQLSTATAGKGKKGPNFMSSGGRSPQPILVSEIYDEVHLK